MINTKALDEAVKSACKEFNPTLPLENCQCSSGEASRVNLAGPFYAIVQREYRRIMAEKIRNHV